MNLTLCKVKRSTKGRIKKKWQTCNETNKAVRQMWWKNNKNTDIKHFFPSFCSIDRMRSFQGATMLLLPNGGLSRL